tara:strand:- start:3449 stop:3787 length:339 start_codon:yes stop_codon:yes gene_type:complete
MIQKKKNHNLTLYQIAISYWEFNPIQRLIVCKVFSFWVSCLFGCLQKSFDFGITQVLLSLLMEVRGLFFRTLYITPFGHGFRIAVDLPEIYSKNVALFTKSAFCKESKNVPS